MSLLEAKVHMTQAISKKEGRKVSEIGSPVFANLDEEQNHSVIVESRKL